VFLDRLQRAQCIERQVWDQRRTRLQASQDAGFVAEVMEKRVDAEIPVVAGDLAGGGPRRRGRQRLSVRAQHTFAAAGGSGGEQMSLTSSGTTAEARAATASAAPGSIPRAMKSSHVPSSASIGIRTMWRSAGSAVRSRSPTRSLPRKRPIPNSTGVSVRARMSLLRPRCSGCSAEPWQRLRGGSPGRPPPNARCSATRWPPGLRAARRARSARLPPGAPQRASRRP